MTKKEIMMMVKVLAGSNRKSHSRYIGEISTRIDALIASAPVPDRQTSNAYYCAEFAKWKESQK